METAKKSARCEPGLKAIFKIFYDMPQHSDWWGSNFWDPHTPWHVNGENQGSKQDPFRISLDSSTPGPSSEALL